MACLVVLCGLPALAQGDEDLQARQLDSLFAFSHANGMFNGAISVWKGDALLFEGYYGSADEANNVPIDSSSLFYLASLSKQMTAMGIMLLAEEQLLDYDDALGTLWETCPTHLQASTVRQLLNHTSGLSDREYYRLKNPSNQDVLDVLYAQDTLTFVPGSTFRYSNSGYVVLAKLIEHLAQQRLEAFFQQRIFTPAGMTSATADRVKAQSSPNKAEGYNQIGKNVGYGSSVIGPGGIYATIKDIGKWNKALNNHSLVPEATLEAAFAPGLLDTGPISFTLGGQESSYGFGWICFTAQGEEYVQHDGSVESYRSMIKKNLTTGYAYAYLTNNGSRIAMNGIGKALDLILEESTYAPPLVPMTNAIIQANQRYNQVEAAAKIRRALTEERGRYEREERALNRLGYAYLGDQQIATAIDVFSLVVEEYPESWNAHDSLGEAYFADKQYELAKQHYLVSVGLNAKNASGQEMLTRIEAELSAGE